TLTSLTAVPPLSLHDALPIFAPGSKVVTDYYEKAGLTDDLEALGFYTVGYGCTTCIGNSGPLIDEVSDAVNEHDLAVTAVLSGRSEEHTSELQSRENLVCRLL